MLSRPKDFFTRFAVFTLAFVSFACLLGTMYGLWPMRAFACWIFPPTLAALAVFVGHGRDPARFWIVEGALGGLVAAVAYDLFRLPFVLRGAPLFRPMTRFGELLIGATEPRWLVETTGWLYHFSNGAALGIMFLALLPWIFKRRAPTAIETRFKSNLSSTLLGQLKRVAGHPAFWLAILWALLVELILLVTRYAEFLGLARNARFLTLTLCAHIVFGLTLGAWLALRLVKTEEHSTAN